MCKFNNKLFTSYLIWWNLFALLADTCNGGPVDFLLFDDYDETGSPLAGPDYDLNYDQRQNGTGNFRLSIDGVVIGMPSSAMTSDMMGTLAQNYILGLVKAANKGDGSNTESASTDTNANDRPYEFETTSFEPEGAEQTEAIAVDEATFEESSKTLPLVKNQRVVQIRSPATPTNSNSVSTVPKKAFAQRRGPNNNGKNTPRRRNK